MEQDNISKEHERIHYMDNVRALAMTLGLFFHASLAYNPLASSFWLPANHESSVSIDVLFSFSHIFRMPLFFLVAGFFALMLIEKRGIKGFLWHRTKRILVPFIIFLPIVLASIIGSVYWAIAHIDNPTDLLIYIQKPRDESQMKITTLHLWFLFNLFLFSLALAFIRKIPKVISFVKTHLQNKYVYIIVFPLLMLPALITQPLPYPPPDKFYPQLWSFGYFGLFFLVGSIFYIHRSLIDTLKPYTFIFLAIGIICHAITYANMPSDITIEEVEAYLTTPPDITFEHIVHAILISVSSSYLTFAFLIWGYQFLNRSNSVLRFISNSSYWVYIIHIPILFFVQFYFLDLHWHPWIEFIVTSFLTFSLCLISYRLFVSWTFIGWMLNGRAQQQKSTAGNNSLPT